MACKVASSTPISNKEQSLIGNVSHKQSQKQFDVKFDVIERDLDDEAEYAAVKHDKVPVHSHQEEITKRVPFVFEKHWAFLLQVINRWSIEQTIDKWSLFDVLFGLSSNLFDASHEKLIHDLSGRLCSVDIKTLRYGIITREEFASSS